MDPTLGELRFIPEVRSAHFERSHRPMNRLVLYAGEYADLDRRSAHGRAHRVSPWLAWTWAFRGRRRVVELPEPLWLRALPFTYSIGLAFRLVDLVCRRRTLIVTYAMENNAPERLFRPLPAPGRRALAAVIRTLGAVVYDRIAFASPGAETCYRVAGVLPAAAATRNLVELMPRCACDDGDHEPGTVVFLGALEARKGVPDLLEAWSMLPARANGWVLRIAGSGPCHEQVLRAAAADPSIDYVGAVGRTAVHTLLRRAAVLVLPSRREGRWCEQIGLPINEGLAHGCRIVATPDTGLAPWLREHGQVVLPEAFTVRQLAQALSDAVAATSLGPDHVVEELPPVDTRVLAEDWMYAADPADPEDPQPTLRAPGTAIPSSTYGGFETLIRHLAPYLQGAGHDVTVYDRSPGPRWSRTSIVDGIRVVRSVGTSGSTTSTLSHGLTSAAMAAADRPDVALIMNVANGFFLPALRARGVRTVLNVDGIEWERAKWSPLGRKVFRTGALATARWADLLVADSHAIAARWHREFGRESVFIPYGGDRDDSGVDPARVRELGVEPGGYVLVVARFVPENNVELMLEAGRRTGRPVVVVGSNPGSELDARLRAHHAPPAVHMLGHVADQDLLSSLWAHCGVYLHGHSVGGTNPALVQAMGMGAPTVALDTVYNREVLERDDMLAPGDVAEIAGRASALLESPARRQDAAAWGRSRVAGVYNWADVCKAYEQVALRALGR